MARNYYQSRIHVNDVGNNGDERRIELSFKCRCHHRDFKYSVHFLNHEKLTDFHKDLMNGSPTEMNVLSSFFQKIFTTYDENIQRDRECDVIPIVLRNLKNSHNYKITLREMIAVDTFTSDFPNNTYQYIRVSCSCPRNGQAYYIFHPRHNAFIQQDDHSFDKVTSMISFTLNNLYMSNRGCNCEQVRVHLNELSTKIGIILPMIHSILQ